MFWVVLLVVLLFIVLPTFYFKNKVHADVQGIFTLWKTKHGLKFLQDLAKKENIWKWFADLGIMIAFGLLGFYFVIKKDRRHLWKNIITYVFFIALFLVVAYPAISGQFGLSAVSLIILILFGCGPLFTYLLFDQSLSIVLSYLNGIRPLPGIAPAIPGLEIPGSPISVPLSAIFAFVVLLFVHESAHGILAIVHKIKVHSLGILTLGVIPLGAFTEPDEKQLKKAPQLDRMRVFAAGSTANFFAAAVFLLLFIGLTIPLAPVMTAMTQQAEISYLIVGSVSLGSPAFAAGIEKGMKIYNVNDLLYPDKNSKEVTLLTDKGNISLTRDEKGFIGLGSNMNFVYKNINPWYWLLFYLLEIIEWTYILNFLIGAINLLPMMMMDGGYLFADLIEFYARKLKIKKAEKLAVKLFNYSSIFIIGMLVVNAIPWFF